MSESKPKTEFAEWDGMTPGSPYAIAHGLAFRLYVWSGKLDPEEIDRTVPVFNSFETFVLAEEKEDCNAHGTS